MVYALNVFNLASGADDAYRSYAIRAGRLLQQVGASVALSGHRALRVLDGAPAREYFMIVQFVDEVAFEEFVDLLDQGGMGELRKQLTRDYLWTLYEPWDLVDWSRSDGSRKAAASDARDPAWKVPR